MQPLVSLLSVALLASVLSVRACIEDTYESMNIYDGMHIMGISPRSGQTVWTRSISVVAATLLPASDVFTLVNRRGWQFNTTLTYIDQNTAVVAPLTIPAFSSSPSQPFTLDFADSFTNRGVPVLEGRVRLTSDIFQNSFSFLTNFKYEVEFEFRPSAPLPPTIPLIGYGKGFTSVTPALPTPSTFTDHAFRLGMACFYNNGNAACLLAQLAEYVHTNVRSAGYKSTLCRGTPSFDAFGLNDGTRALSRILKAQYGEAPIAGKHGLMSVPLQTSSGTGSALTCGEQTVKAATDRSPIMHAQLAAGRALRDRIVSESGVVIDAEEHAGFPKPIPPIPSRLDFGALLTAEGKRIGIEVGVQRGLNLEALLLTWPTCELVFAVDPWDTQENYVDIANFNDQDAVFNVRCADLVSAPALHSCSSCMFPCAGGNASSGAVRECRPPAGLLSRSGQSVPGWVFRLHLRGRAPRLRKRAVRLASVLAEACEGWHHGWS